MKHIAGVLPVPHTPFHDDESIDWSSFERQVKWAIESGADGVCTGMVTEWLRLTVAERFEMMQRLVSVVEGRKPVVVSVGAESTLQAVDFAQHAERVECDAVMAIPPLSTALGDQAVFDYFSSILKSISLPLIVQDASSYVGQSISMVVYKRLLDEFGSDRVLFKPEAAPLAPNVSRLRDETDGRARIFEGSGGISLIDSYRRGITGTIPGMEFLPGIVEIWRALEQSDEGRAYEVYLPVCALVAIQMQAGLDGFLAIEKYVLQKRGLFNTTIRRQPYRWVPDRETLEEVDRLLDKLESVLAD